MAEQMSYQTEEFTPALTQVLGRGVVINRAYEKEVDVSFTSLLLAFLAEGDPLSRWFQGYVDSAGVDVDAILAERGLGREGFSAIVGDSLPTDVSGLRQSISLEKLFGTAENLRSMAPPDDPSEPLDVRHVMGAYIYDPAGHEAQLEGWGFDREQWSNAFLSQLAGTHLGELEHWKEIHRQYFGSESLVDGPSTHIATDRWTLEDTLGYRAYAHAIYRFMTHPQTRPPLTISIQAPWGGGKTSLMRMVQQALDPDAVRETSQAAEQEARRSHRPITVRQVLDELDQDQDVADKDLPSVGELYQRSTDGEHRKLTVWFNVWKYQSTNQVWAGLADEIVRQIAARLPSGERELFWLRLNLKRVDTDQIRHEIHERVFRYWWREARPWVLSTGASLVAGVLITLAGGATNLSQLQNLGWLGMIASAIGGAGQVVRLRGAKQSVEDEPADASFSKYLTIPDYRSELGFIHHVEADLRRVFECVPEDYRPIVIFIDDLDRCRPEKVAEVVEAINLFLAGDFPDCVFVLGMDAEMVAAALEAAHAEVIPRLPADAATPIGWRFMDKFVQLPFVIPPAEIDDLDRYTRDLLSGSDEPDDPLVRQLARESADRVRDMRSLDRELDRLPREHELTTEQVDSVREQLETQAVLGTLDAGIETFSDKNPEIRTLVEQAASAFSRNPRELKRFINAFRFQYFLWWARRARGLEAPSLDQLQRWVIFSMKWPEVVRWIRRSGGREERGMVEDEAPTGPSRLEQLEKAGDGAVDLTTWFQRAEEILHLTPEATPWLNDDDLREFFFDEFMDWPEGARLSDAAGRGLW